MDFSFHASCMCIPSPHPELGSMFPQLGCNLTAQYNGWEWHPGTSEAWFLEALNLSPRLIGALTLEKVRGPTTLRPPYGEKHKPRGQTQDMPCGEKERPQRIGAPDIWMKRSFWNCVLQPQMPSCQCPGSEINHSVKIFLNSDPHVISKSNNCCESQSLEVACYPEIIKWDNFQCHFQTAENPALWAFNAEEKGAFPFF